MLDHAQRLMAHLSMVRMAMVCRGEGTLDQSRWSLRSRTPRGARRGLAPRGWVAQVDAAEPDVRRSSACRRTRPHDPLPWFVRRLQATAHEGESWRAPRRGACKAERGRAKARCELDDALVRWVQARARQCIVAATSGLSSESIVGISSVTVGWM
jgi:hypothetical protein